MRYVITLDKDSFIGCYLQAGGHDGLNGGHPTIDCESIDTGHHAFLHAVWDRPGTPKRTMSLRIPYSAVLLILEYAHKEQQIGFS